MHGHLPQSFPEAFGYLRNPVKAASMLTWTGIWHLLAPQGTVYLSSYCSDYAQGKPSTLSSWGEKKKKKAFCISYFSLALATNRPRCTAEEMLTESRKREDITALKLQEGQQQHRILQEFLHSSTTLWRGQSVCHRPEVCLHCQYVK